jgi:hypothetical protein
VHHHLGNANGKALARSWQQNARNAVASGMGCCVVILQSAIAWSIARHAFVAYMSLTFSDRLQDNQ